MADSPDPEGCPPGFTPPARCGRCGYATAGLPGTTCPECAFDLTKVPYLRFADRAWLRTIVFGTKLISFGAVGLLATNFGAVGVLRAVVKSIGIDTFSDKIVARVLLATFLACGAIGAWLLSTPDPALEVGDDARLRRRTFERMGIAAALLLGAARVGCEGLVPPAACAVMTVAAMGFGLFIVVGLNALVLELLARSESAPKEEVESKPYSASWVIWMIALFVLIGLWSAGAGVATVAIKVERVMLGIGAIATGLALLKLVKSSKAIHEELGKASADADVL